MFEKFGWKQITKSKIIQHQYDTKKTKKRVKTPPPGFSVLLGQKKLPTLHGASQEKTYRVLLQIIPDHAAKYSQACDWQHQKDIKIHCKHVESIRLVSN